MICNWDVVFRVATGQEKARKGLNNCHFRKKSGKSNIGQKKLRKSPKVKKKSGKTQCFPSKFTRKCNIRPTLGYSFVEWHSWYALLLLGLMHMDWSVSVTHSIEPSGLTVHFIYLFVFLQNSIVFSVLWTFILKIFLTSLWSAWIDLKWLVGFDLWYEKISICNS